MAKVVPRPPLSYYLDLKYPILVFEDPGGGYVAEVADLPGCITQAETLGELMEMVQDAKGLWLEVAYKDGQEIPLPRTEQVYSGKFVVRAPASLHRRLAQAAAEEGISLNQYVVQHLAGSGDLRQVLRRLDTIEQQVASLEKALSPAERSWSAPSESTFAADSPFVADDVAGTVHLPESKHIRESDSALLPKSSRAGRPSSTPPPPKTGIDQTQRDKPKRRRASSTG